MFIGAVDVSIPCYRFDVRFNTFTLLKVLFYLFFGSVVGSVRFAAPAAPAAMRQQQREAVRPAQAGKARVGQVMRRMGFTILH